MFWVISFPPGLAWRLELAEPMTCKVLSLRPCASYSFSGMSGESLGLACDTPQPEEVTPEVPVVVVEPIVSSWRGVDLLAATLFRFSILDSNRGGIIGSGKFRMCNYSKEGTKWHCLVSSLDLGNTLRMYPSGLGCSVWGRSPQVAEDRHTDVCTEDMVMASS